MDKDIRKKYRERAEKVLKVARQLRSKKGYYYRKWRKNWIKGVKKHLKGLK